jgi:hypothetical protein
MSCQSQEQGWSKFQCSTTSRTECNEYGVYCGFASKYEFQCSTTSRTECNLSFILFRFKPLSGFSAQPRAEQNVTVTLTATTIASRASFSAQPRAEQNVTSLLLQPFTKRPRFQCSTTSRTECNLNELSVTGTRLVEVSVLNHEPNRM